MRAAFAIASLTVLSIGLSLLLNLPPYSGHLLSVYHAPVSLELILLLTAIALLPALQGQGFRHFAAALLFTAVLLRLADLITEIILSRPANLYIDVRQLWPLTEFSLGVLGPWQSALIAVAGFLALALLYGAGFTLMGLAQRHLPRQRPGTAVICLLAGTTYMLQPIERLGGRFYVDLTASPTLTAQGRRIWETWRADAAFRLQLNDDPFADRVHGTPLFGLQGVDVLLLFVESYGRSAIQDPRYAATIVPTLERFADSLAQGGWQAVSGWLLSPTAGGQSWLAHDTLLSGLWIDSQVRHDLLVNSRRRTLIDDFNAAGYRTVAVKPAFTRHWPEGAFFGYDQVYARDDLGYAGPPYDWMTMPDQYTLAVLERRERTDRNRPPLFAEVALISSHVPWTPVPEVLDDWSQIGDGTLFARWAQTGEPVDEIWLDETRIRRQYVLALNYVLRLLQSYVLRFADSRTLVIIVGDHQPLPVITGEEAPRTVPMHVISTTPALLQPFLDWGCTPGLLPETTVHSMADFRDRLLAGFSATPDSASHGQ